MCVSVGVGVFRGEERWHGRGNRKVKVKVKVNGGKDARGRKGASEMGRMEGRRERKEKRKEKGPQEVQRAWTTHAAEVNKLATG